MLLIRENGKKGEGRKEVKGESEGREGRGERGIKIGR